MFIALLLASCSLHAQPQLSWSAGHANAPIPGQEATAGYLTVINSGDEEDTLIGFSSAAAAMVQLHETSMNNGMMSMNHIESIVVPAGGSVHMQPGGFHLMIMGVDKEAFMADSLDIDLHFASGTTITATLPIKSMHAGH
jgi:periplasmic copper chaperone A